MGGVGGWGVSRPVRLGGRGGDDDACGRACVGPRPRVVAWPIDLGGGSGPGIGQPGTSQNDDVYVWLVYFVLSTRISTVGRRRL